MDHSAPLPVIKDFIENFIKKWPEVFFVDSSITPANKVTVLLDADNGMNIEKCAEVNRALVKFVESEQVFGEKNFSTEISSPGIDRPLTSRRQYRKNIGRNVEVTKTDDTLVEGKLIDTDENGLTLEIAINQKKKKSETEKLIISFTEIRQVKVLVTF